MRATIGIVIWTLGVLWEYRNIPSEHELFRYHTIAACVVACSVTIGTEIFAFNYRWKMHRNAMIFGTIAAFGTASLMLYKKLPLGFLIVGGRVPSYHSGCALILMSLFVLLSMSGMAIMYKILLSSGRRNVTKMTRQFHRRVGFVASTLILLACALGLAEKNDMMSRHFLAWSLLLIWVLLWGPRISTLL